MIEFLETESGRLWKETKRLWKRSYPSTLCIPQWLQGDPPFSKGVDWCPILERYRREMEAPFSLKEIRGVVFGLERDKAHGPYGFSMEYIY